MALAKTFVFGWVLVAVAVASDRRFPPGFKFGAATSAHQIEGAWKAADKSVNIWDVFAQKPGAIANNDTADVACDSYYKWKVDIQIAVDLGLDFYRFSICWSRLLPTGFPDKISEAGKKYYSDLIDGLLDKGIEPVVTLYHWDMPQRLQNLGGWTNPLMTDWFAYYAKVVYSLYGDRVKTWITINEPNIMCDMTYNTGTMAPGVKDPYGAFLCGKNVMLAHAKAWRIYDTEFKPKYNGRVSFTNHIVWLEPESHESEEIIGLARDISMGFYSHPIYSKKGGWPPALEKLIAKNSRAEGLPASKLPPFTKEEIELVRGTYDFFGLNYYTCWLFRKAKQGEEVGPWPLAGIPELDLVLTRGSDWEQAATNWFNICPKGLRKILVWLKKNYGDIDINIVENGYSTVDRNLEDTKRKQYFADHLEQTLLAIKKNGVNVTAYTAWSMMDNFEWSEGYSTKFGIYDVDFDVENRTRTPRASANYYASVIKSHSLDVDKHTYNNYISDELYIVVFILRVSYA